jgi:hypothetical protein
VNPEVAVTVVAVLLVMTAAVGRPAVLRATASILRVLVRLLRAVARVLERRRG